MNLVTSGKGLLDLVDKKYYLYDDFEIDLLNRVERFGLSINKELNESILAYRMNPIWTYSGTYHKVESGYLRILAVEFPPKTCSCLSSVNVGSWEFDIRIPVMFTAGSVLLRFIFEDDDNYYCLIIESDNRVLLKIKGGGENTWILDPEINLLENVWQKLRVTRDLLGVFEVFLDDVSYGTVQRDFAPISNNISLNHHHNDELQIRSIKVI